MTQNIPVRKTIKSTRQNQGHETVIVDEQATAIYQDGVLRVYAHPPKFQEKPLLTLCVTGVTLSLIDECDWDS